MSDNQTKTEAANSAHKSNPNKEIDIYGTKYLLSVGSLIHPEGWGKYPAGTRLVQSHWDNAEFYLETISGKHGGPVKSVAINVKVTGKVFVLPPGMSGRDWVRVRIEFVEADGEATVTGGWWKAREW